MAKENPSNYKTLQIWIKKGIVCILIFKNVVITLRTCTTPQTFIYAVYTGLTQEKELQPLQKKFWLIFIKILVR